MVNNSLFKISSVYDYNFDENPVSIINEAKDLEKRAAVLKLLKYKKTPNQTDLHVIAVGAYEGTGINRNGDFFREQECIRNHPYFVRAGRAVNRHHKNKPTDPKYGDIKASAYNEAMKRIELIIGIDNDVGADIIQKQEREGTTNWSMACSLDPDYPILTKRGYVGIGRVEVGDLVLTHEGNWKKVKEVNTKKYTGETVKLRINGLPEFPELTSNHLLYATAFPSKNSPTQTQRYFNNPKDFLQYEPNWTHVAHLKKGDRIFYRIPKYDYSNVKIDDIDLAKILGYYLAEGSCNDTTVEFSCNVDDSIVEALPEIVSRKYPDLNVTLRLRSNTEVGLSIDISNVQLKKLCEKYVGRRVENKQIPVEILNADEEIKSAFFSTWLEGDGWVNKKGLHISTSNFNLALQGRDLLMSLGIPSSIYRIDHAKSKNSGYVGSGVEYTLNVSWLHHDKFEKYSPKVSKGLAKYHADGVGDYKTGMACLRPTPDPSLFAYRVSDVETRHVTDADIYNIEVEDDESYVLGGVISHNCRVPFDICSWCENKSRTDKDRCHHIPLNIGDIREDGVMCGMENINPKWFEISYVKRPADRIGYGLKKVASAFTIQPMSPTDYLRIYPDFTVPRDDEDFYISKHASDKRELLKKLADHEKHIAAVGKPVGIKAESISDATMDEARKLEPDRFFKLAADNQIILSPNEFVRYVFGTRVKEANLVPYLDNAFSKALDNPDIINNERYEPSTTYRATTLEKQAVANLKECSLRNSDIRHKLTTNVSKTIRSGINKQAEVLANEYTAYKLAALNYINNKNQLTEDLMFNAIIQNR